MSAVRGSYLDQLLKCTLTKECKATGFWNLISTTHAIPIWALFLNVHFDTDNPRPEKFSETIIECTKEMFATGENEFQAT